MDQNENDLLGALERMAANGTAPVTGCATFSVGYGDSFDRLSKRYIEQQFARGRSADKFVVGPYGIGKTHFCRQLLEVARGKGCVTAELQLNKDVDFTKTQTVYRELVRVIQTPAGRARGMRSLLQSALDHVAANAPDDELIRRQFITGWIKGLSSHDFELDAFGRVVVRALEAMDAGEDTLADACIEWLSGDFTDRKISESAGRSVVSSSDANNFASRMMMSLFQFVRAARFQGTVVVFDESEQGLNVSNKKTEVILSMLQSRINATADLKDGSVLTVYALTNDLMEKMSRLPALEQRVADPGPDQSFFKGFTLTPRINLDELQSGQSALERIGHKYLEVASSLSNWDSSIDLANQRSTISQFAREIALEDATSESRRTMAKRTCSHLLYLIDGELRTQVDGLEAEDEV